MTEAQTKAEATQAAHEVNHGSKKEMLDVLNKGEDKDPIRFTTADVGYLKEEIGGEQKTTRV
jgi:hypothetical protein